MLQRAAVDCSRAPLQLEVGAVAAEVSTQSASLQLEVGHVSAEVSTADGCCWLHSQLLRLHSCTCGSCIHSVRLEPLAEAAVSALHSALH